MNYLLGMKRNVFLNVEWVRTRSNTSKFKAQWVTRGASQVVYTSKACESMEDAKSLAHKWLARNHYMYVDTTSPST